MLIVALGVLVPSASLAAPDLASVPSVPALRSFPAVPPAQAAASPPGAPRLGALRLSGSLETRLPADSDAERVLLDARAVTAGVRIVVAGRLARVTLEPRPWEGDVWQVRYTLQPAPGNANSSTRPRALSGVFQLRENERKEIWFGSGAVHGLRLQLDAPKGMGLRTL
jgi:hypothetical protein